MLLFDSNRYHYSRERGPESNDNEGVLHILESFRTGVSPLDGLLSHLGHSFGGGFPSGKLHSTYSTAPANGTENSKKGRNMMNVKLRKKIEATKLKE